MDQSLSLILLTTLKIDLKLAFTRVQFFKNLTFRNLGGLAQIILFLRWANSYCIEEMREKIIVALKSQI